MVAQQLSCLIKTTEDLGEKRGVGGMEEGIPYQASKEGRSQSVFKLQGNNIAAQP